MSGIRFSTNQMQMKHTRTESMRIWLRGARISAICIGVAVSSDSYCPPDNTLTNR
jgi:hypothetical protein